VKSFFDSLGQIAHLVLEALITFSVFMQLLPDIFQSLLNLFKTYIPA
jgi:hypothetical protein